jgi:hypothetical protein
MIIIWNTYNYIQGFQIYFHLFLFNYFEHSRNESENPDIGMKIEPIIYYISFLRIHSGNVSGILLHCY